MPNHVTTVCTVTGPAADVAAFVERHIVPVPEKKEGRFFDFGTIIPKPAIVSETQSGSQAEVGLFALTGQYRKPRFFGPEDTSNPAEIWRYLPREVDTREKLLAHLKEKDPKALEWGEKAKRCLEETGHPDWYEWSIANWGTKWGAYDFAERERGDGRYVFKFETAWSFPEKPFRKLAELYPSLVFDVASFDEGGNFGCVGQFNGQNDYRCDKDLGSDDALYERVYGRKPPRYDDDGNEIEEPTELPGEGGSK